MTSTGSTMESSPLNQFSRGRIFTSVLRSSPSSVSLCKARTRKRPVVSRRPESSSAAEASSGESVYSPSMKKTASLSGVIFFADYAPEGMNPLAYSAAYNGSYIAAEGALTLILLAIPAVRIALNRVKAEANEKNLRKAVSMG